MSSQSSFGSRALSQLSSHTTPGPNKSDQDRVIRHRGRTSAPLLRSKWGRKQRPHQEDDSPVEDIKHEQHSNEEVERVCDKIILLKEKQIYLGHAPNIQRKDISTSEINITAKSRSAFQFENWQPQKIFHGLIALLQNTVKTLTNWSVSSPGIDYKISIVHVEALRTLAFFTKGQRGESNVVVLLLILNLKNRIDWILRVPVRSYVDVTDIQPEVLPFWWLH